MLKWFKKGTWWRHLVLLIPVVYYAVRTKTMAEKAMIGGAVFVLLLMVEKIYEKSEPEDLDPKEVIPRPFS